MAGLLQWLGGKNEAYSQFSQSTDVRYELRPTAWVAADVSKTMAIEKHFKKGLYSDYGFLGGFGLYITERFIV